MHILYINSSFREGSRTDRLAEKYISDRFPGSEVTRLELGDLDPDYLDRERLKVYLRSCAEADFSDPMFDIPKQFRDAQEIVISAPYWNMGLPAVLHAYLELVCSQGVTFDVADDGTYLKLCKANSLTFVITAGGPISREDHAYGFIKQLNETFWGIPDIRCLRAENLDLTGNNPEKILSKATLY